jgi:hypothetical protein
LNKRNLEKNVLKEKSAYFCTISKPKVVSRIAKMAPIYFEKS